MCVCVCRGVGGGGATSGMLCLGIFCLYSERLVLYAAPRPFWWGVGVGVGEWAPSVLSVPRPFFRFVQ